MSQELTDALVKVMEAVLIGVLTAYLPKCFAYMFKIANAAWQYYCAHVSAEQRGEIEAIVTIAVKAAEQFGLVAAAKNELFDKKQFAIGAAQAALTQKGIKIDLTDLDNRVEAAVFTAFNQAKQAQSAQPGDAEQPAPASTVPAAA